MAASTLDKTVPEILPPSLDATSDQPPLFDGTIRLYTSYSCGFAQRVWITRNYKGLQDTIKLVPLNLANRPSWYPQNVYSGNKVPALEHNGKIIGESLDLMKYVETNFQGPSLLPTDPAKKEFAEELFAYTDKFVGALFASMKGDMIQLTAPSFDYLENALQKFDGPFLLGDQFSLADIAYITFVERLLIFCSEVLKCDITSDRPNFAAWIEEINKIEAYKQTKPDPVEVVAVFKKYTGL
ncbi:Glutathione S-transferase family protein [Euphorbia peplus]|nr:Glutathione S-transferase family protein [Euphorbia peplus]